jgi:hypothetical protein
MWRLLYKDQQNFKNITNFLMQFECCCCFDNVSLNYAVSCPDGHPSCVECIQRSMSVCVGEQSLIKCFDQSGCGASFSEIALSRAFLDPKLKRSYDTIETQKNIKNSGLENTYGCPFCDNIVIVDGQHHLDTFYCTACEKASCTRCRNDQHQGHCDEKKRKQDKKSDDLIIVCFCSTPLLLGDGCNKLTCTTCKTIWCWICKENLTGKTPYKHFGPNGPKRCKLYGERPKNQEFTDVDRARPVPLPITRESQERDRLVRQRHARLGMCGLFLANGGKRPRELCIGRAKTGTNRCEKHTMPAPRAVPGPAPRAVLYECRERDQRQGLCGLLLGRELCTGIARPGTNRCEKHTTLPEMCHSLFASGDKRGQICNKRVKLGINKCGLHSRS